MHLQETGIKGCYVLEPRIFKDDRGQLVKIFHKDVYTDLGLVTDFNEEYYSVSKKGVLRGLHFQIPPHGHIKCVTCLQGSILDAVVDLRRNSATYLKHFVIELNEHNAKMLYIPEGLAHGFYVLSDSAIFLNRTTTVYEPNSDKGILWESCGINWPNRNPIISEKDKQLPELNEFISPF